jgi:uncharacterized protein (TIGR02646 family)
MKLIIKGNEPDAWKAYYNTEGVTKYTSPNSELKHALLKDQGYICCYCMSRISFDKMVVEHFKSRDNHKEKRFQFGFDNLLASCTGNFHTDKHCDCRKKSEELTINPTDIKNNCESIIGYKWSDGGLTYPPQYKNDIEEILNLNNPVLKRNRKEVLEAITSVLSLKKFSKSECQKQLKKFKEPNNEGKLQPYCIVGIRFLEKKLRQMA